MADPVKFKINPVHLVLEIVGSLLAGIGLAEAYANTNLVPAGWQFENYGWYMVAAGLLMGVPYTFSLIKHAKTAKSNVP